jgi:5-methylcytosine-specific restriction endonuclease McrBC regulatory subunit McrC
MFLQQLCSFTFAISALKYNPFATKLKACRVVKTATTILAKCKVLIEVQAEAKETGDNLDMINQT